MNSVSSKSYLTEEKSRLLFNSVTSPGMTDLYKGRPRGYQQVETVSVETEVTFDMRGVTYNGNKSLEEQKQTIFFKDIMRNARMEKLNFEQCSLIGCNVLAYKLRHNASSGLTPVGLQLNFEHKGMGDHIDLFNRIAETVTPGIGGMFLEVQNPNDEWKTLPIPASPFLSLDKTKGIFGYVNAHFQSTYCLANADNITNGIVIIRASRLQRRAASAQRLHRLQGRVGTRLRGYLFETTQQPQCGDTLGGYSGRPRSRLGTQLG